MDFSQLKFDANGLIPAIAQDARTNQVLMLAYMNQQSIEQTLETGYATYFNFVPGRRCGRRGETSGTRRSSSPCATTATTRAADGGASRAGVPHGRKSCFSTTCMWMRTRPRPQVILQEDYATIADRAASRGRQLHYLLDNGVENLQEGWRGKPARRLSPR